MGVLAAALPAAAALQGAGDTKHQTKLICVVEKCYNGLTMEKRLTYNIEVERDEDGVYVVSVPALPGCLTQGKTFDEAVRMAQDAITGFIKVLANRGKEIPIDRSRTSPFSVSIVSPKVLA